MAGEQLFYNFSSYFKQHISGDCLSLWYILYRLSNYKPGVQIRRRKEIATQSHKWVEEGKITSKIQIGKQCYVFCSAHKMVKYML